MSEHAVILSNEEVELLLEELHSRATKYKHAKGRLEGAQSAMYEIIEAIYPYVSGNIIGDICGLTRTRVWQIARGNHGDDTNG